MTRNPNIVVQKRGASTANRAAEIAFNDLIGSMADEWMPLNEMEREDREWLLAKFPAVHARMFSVPFGSPETGRAVHNERPAQDVHNLHNGALDRG